MIFGKSTSPELGLTNTTESVLFGQTHNPWNLERTPGGSSGGSAALVASRIVPMAHGSDGGGSLRIPASCCGVFGFKPTRGRVPRGPSQFDGWNGCTQHHALMITVRDSAALLDISCGAELGSPFFSPQPERPFSKEVGANPGRLRNASTDAQGLLCTGMVLPGRTVTSEVVRVRPRIVAGSCRHRKMSRVRGECSSLT